MNNYPSGMTKRNWEYLDGEKHYKECPAFPDNIIDGDDIDCRCLCDEIEDSLKLRAIELKYEAAKL